MHPQTKRLKFNILLTTYEILLKDKVCITYAFLLGVYQFFLCHILWIGWDDKSWVSELHPVGQIWLIFYDFWTKNGFYVFRWCKNKEYVTETITHLSAKSWNIYHLGLYRKSCQLLTYIKLVWHSVLICKIVKEEEDT